MNTIEDRTEISVLVKTFYNKIKEDAFIGPIFLKAIPEHEWEVHLEKLTDFWETNLFFKKKYKGNPMQVHVELDVKNNYTITQKHFEKWLELWMSTLDELFVGEKALKAKESARNISFMLFLKILTNKPNSVV
ncbi:group III truncated hemoglobin [Polaribacter sp. HL-MS24]|uniref:group III truncated hemoglobin n=1 Tax=Polaribacter sp. HL-MS24 TaxID=3077735 RepID=UPI002934DA69|nr:group III truncated hemoglobin [Polaribacter sp. HL-MS24]WOC40360.1 group III truncated hemoglobin [Polaribacter sp. HL-MS24]